MNGRSRGRGHGGGYRRAGDGGSGHGAPDLAREGAEARREEAEEELGVEAPARQEAAAAARTGSVGEGLARKARRRRPGR